MSEAKPVPFKKIKSDEYADGQIVMCIAGTITSIYAAKTGDTYEYQNGKIKDSEGTEMDISFSKNTQPLTAKGKKVTIKSIKSEQHGWLGIKVEDQSYTPQGKDEPVQKRVLKITATAEVVYDGGTTTASGKSDSGATGATKSSQGSQGGRHPDEVLRELIMMHARCYDFAKGVYDPKEMPAQLQSATASIFIEACKMGVAYNFVEEVSKPVPPKITTAPSDPSLWKTCMIPSGLMVGKTLADLDDDGMMKFYEALKDKETKFANCVKQAAEDRGLLKQAEPDPLEPSEDSDDIPF